MSLQSTISRNSYIGNGTTAIYDYAFKIFAESDLKVFVKNTSSSVETLLVIGTDYTVAGVENTAGGEITLVDMNQAWLDASGFLATGYSITIRRVRPITQTTDIRNQGDFFPEVHEDQFDKLVMVDQQQQDDIDRSIKLPDTISGSAFNAKLPATILGSLNKAIITNATGDGFAVGPSADEISNAQSNANAAAASAASASASSVSAAASAASAAAAVTGVTPAISGTRASPNDITAAGGISFSSGSYFNTQFIQGSGGVVDITADPQIQVGTLVGQRLMIIGRSDTNTVKLDDGTGLSLNGPVILQADSLIELIWDGTNWTEISRR